MRILHIAPIGHRAEGIGTVLGHLVKEQEALGNEVRIVTIHENVLYVDWKNLFVIKSLKTFYSFLKDFNPDIAHFHSTFELLYIPYSFILRRNKVPYIVQMHGAMSIENYKRSHIKKILANKIAFSSFLRYSKGLVFLNSNEQANCVERKQNARHFILPNGCDAVENLYNEKRNGGKLDIIYIGRIDIYHKGIDVLIESFALIPKEIRSSIHFSFYGNEKDYDVDRLKILLRPYSYMAAYYGGLYGRDKDLRLRQADLFVQTSRSEGMPMGVLEALSYGLPCIVTPGTNMADVIESSDCGWVCELTPKSIASVLCKAFSEMNLCSSQYREKALSVSKKFSWKEIGKKSLLIYDNVINAI